MFRLDPCSNQAFLKHFVKEKPSRSSCLASATNWSREERFTRWYHSHVVSGYQTHNRTF
jgi:hypothetical protein